MRKHFYVIVCSGFVVAAVATLIQSCKPQPPREKIQVGAILPLTGNMAIIGKPEQVGIEVALGQLRSESPATSLEIVFGDSQGAPKTAVTVARELIAKRKLDALIVSTAPCVLAVKPVAEEQGIPLFAITSQPEIADGKTVFRISPNSTTETQAVIDYARKVGIKHLALIYPNNELGEKIRQIAEQHSQPDLHLNLTTEYSVGEKDFRTLILKIKGSGADAVYFAGYPFDIPAFARQFKESGATIMFLTSMGAVWPSATEGLSDACVSPVFPTPGFGVPALRSETARVFAKQFETQSVTPANYDAAFAYDTVQVMHRLLAGGDTKTPRAARWVSIGQYQGVSGPIAFLTNGETAVSLYMATISGKTVVKADASK